MQEKFSEIAKKFLLDFLACPAKVPAVMKKELLSAREALQENLRTLLDGLPVEAVDRACQMVVETFAPLLTQKREVRSIVTKQIGDVGFRVVKTTNLLDIKVGSMVTPAQAQTMRAEGINFTVMRNS